LDKQHDAFTNNIQNDSYHRQFHVVNTGTFSGEMAINLRELFF